MTRTREEAIKMAKAYLMRMERDVSGQDEMCNSHKCDECSLNYEQGSMGEQKEWLRMAIKALEQEPCEDAISRQAVLDAFWKLNVELRPNAIDAILNMVNDMPPVIPQLKTGHWIYKQYDGYPECGDYHCSECDKIDNRTSAHCPNCGAKMQEVEERYEKR